MTDELSDVSMPSMVESKKAFACEVTYTSNSDATLQIDAVTEGFSVKPLSRELPAAPTGQKLTFRLTVTRGSGDAETCRLEFSAFGDLRAKRPWVRT